VFGFQGPKIYVAFQSVSLKLGFSDLRFNHNKNNAFFKVKVEWGIGGLKANWRRLMKRFDSTKKKTITFSRQHHF
jgi:hypothetical protein